MKTFITTQENCAWLGISWHQSLQKYLFNFKNLFALFILTFCAVLNCLYFCYDATTFNEYAISAYTTLTAIVSVITFLITILQMRAQFILIHDIEMILNKSELSAIRWSFYIVKIQCCSILFHIILQDWNIQLHVKCIKMLLHWLKNGPKRLYLSQWMCCSKDLWFQSFWSVIYFTTLPMLEMIFLSCHSLIGQCYYTAIHRFIFFCSSFSNLDSIFNEEFCLHFRYPFEWKNPVGYLVAYIIQYIGIGVMSFFVACCASAGVGFAVFVMLFTKDIKVNLKTVNKKAKSKGDHTQLLMDFCDVIEMHALTKK